MRPSWLKLPSTPAARGMAADVGVLVALGGVGLVGSTRHVLDLAHKHGADGAAPHTGVGSWLVAGVWEVLALYSGVELRRRQGWGRLVPAFTLLLSVAFVVAANLEASGLQILPPWVWRLIIAVSPALVFLAVALLVETRSWKLPTRKPPRARVAGSPSPSPVGSNLGAQPPTPVPLVTPEPPLVDEPDRPDVDLPADVPAAVAAALAKVPPAARRVWLALDQADGPMATGDIMAATELARGTVKAALSRNLIPAHLVVPSPRPGRPKDNVYASRRVAAA